MTVTDIKIENVKEKKNRLLAYASVTLDDVLTINQIKIIESKKDTVFVAFPSRRIDDTFVNLIDFDKQLYKSITNEILREYVRIND